MAVIKTDGGYNSFPISYKRGNPIPLDQSAIWYDYNAMQTYAKSDPVAYVGQILCFVNEKQGEAEAYIILNVDGDIQRLGNAAIDDRSLEIDTGGLIALKNWGVQYYRFIPAVKDDNGNVITPSSYQLQKVNDKYPWLAGLQPRVAAENGQMVLAWYEQNLESIEGIDATLQAMKESLQSLEAEVGNPEDFDKDLPATGIYSLLEEKVDKVYYNVPILDEDGNLTYDDEGNLITSKEEGILLSPEDKKKLDNLVNSDGTVSVENVKGLSRWVTSNRDSVDGLYPTSDANKLAQIETEAEKNVINEVDTSVFTITPGRKLLLNEVPQEKVIGLVPTLGTIISDVDLVKKDVSSLKNVLNGYTDDSGVQIEGLVSTVGNILTSYVSVVNFNATVGNLDQLLASNTTIIEEIDYLKDRLTWQEMSK